MWRKSQRFSDLNYENKLVLIPFLHNALPGNHSRAIPYKERGRAL